jgi:surfactin synthase thioesterase subunit
VGGIPEVLMQEIDVLKLMLPAVRADLQVCAAWGSPPGPPRGCPVSALGGSRVQMAPPTRLEHGRNLGGRSMAVTIFDDGHFFLHDDPGAVARTVEDALLAPNDR